MISKTKMEGVRHAGKVIYRKIKLSSIFYDETCDILEVYTRGKTHHCKNIGDFVIFHFDDKNRPIDIKFLEVSKLHGIPKELLLSNVKSAKLVVLVRSKEKEMFMTVNLKSKDNDYTASLMTPPLKCNQSSISCL